MYFEYSIVYFLLAVILSAVLYYWLVPATRKLLSASDPHKPFRRSELVTVLLGLNDQSLDTLMRLYRKEFGAGPARYAKNTLRRWRSGSVRPAKQTFDRFLVHLPKVMTYDMKCEVLRRFMEEYAGKEHAELEVYTDDWEQKLEPLVRQIVDKAFSAEMPQEVERHLKWLGDGDMQAAKEILKRSQADEGRMMVSMLREEFAAMERVLSAENFKARVTHVLKFPYGTITLYVRKRV